MRRARCLIAIILALGGRATAQQAAERPAAPALPSVTLPAELDRVLRDYERAWGARDVAALVGLFTEDGFVLQSGRPPVRGHAALAERYAGQGGGPLRLRALAYAMADTVGDIIGAYGYGDDPADSGKFTLTLRRSAADRWLIASDMDNGNAPAMPAGFSLHQVMGDRAVGRFIDEDGLETARVYRIEGRTGGPGSGQFSRAQPAEEEPPCVAARLGLPCR